MDLWLTLGKALLQHVDGWVGTATQVAGRKVLQRSGVHDHGAGATGISEPRETSSEPWHRYSDRLSEPFRTKIGGMRFWMLGHLRDSWKAPEVLLSHLHWKSDEKWSSLVSLFPPLRVVGQYTFIFATLSLYTLSIGQGLGMQLGRNLRDRIQTPFLF